MEHKDPGGDEPVHGLVIGRWYVTASVLRLFRSVGGDLPTAAGLDQAFGSPRLAEDYLLSRVDVAHTTYCMPCATTPTSKGTHMQDRGQVSHHLEGERHLRKVEEYEEDLEEERQARERLGPEDPPAASTGCESCSFARSRQHRSPDRDGDGGGGEGPGAGLVA